MKFEKVRSIPDPKQRNEEFYKDMDKLYKMMKKGESYHVEEEGLQTAALVPRIYSYMEKRQLSGTLRVNVRRGEVYVSKN